MIKEKIILQGGGEHARVVLDCLLEQGNEVLALFDPNYSGNLFGVPQLGMYHPDFHPDARAIIAIGDNKVRRKVAITSAHQFSTVIHQSALLSTRCSIGQGSVVLHNTIVQVNSRIGEHAIVNTGAQVDHDCIIGDYVHIAPGSILCGTVSVGEGTFVGAGSTIIQGIKIGKWCVIGAGSVVVKDVPDYTMVVGNPARFVKQLSE